MSTIPSNLEYQHTLYKSLPKGPIWPPINESSTIRTIVDSIAYDTRLQQLATCDMLDSSFPDSADYIADWERVLGLPKTILTEVDFNVGDNNVGEPLGRIILTAELPSDIDIRIAQVLSFFNRTGLNNDQAYIDMGALFEVTVDSVITSPVFTITITTSSGSAENLQSFESLANFFKPAYSELVFVTA